MKLKPLRIESSVIENPPVAAGIYKLSLAGSPAWRRAQPGQFVMLRSLQPGFPILNRPFSIHDILLNSQRTVKGIEILYKVVGRGTELLSRLNPGERVIIVGPLGQGFSLRGGWNAALLVAGGIGLAPFPLLMRKLAEKKSLRRVFLLFGVKRLQEMVPVERFSRKRVAIRLASEEGGLDFHGTVTGLLKDFLQEGVLKNLRTRIFACGPESMLADVSRIAGEAGIPCQVSLEAAMGCGFGVCLSCVHEMRDKEKGVCYKKVCLEGPVFKGDEVIFEGFLRRGFS